MEDISCLFRRVGFITNNVKLIKYIENCIKTNNGKLHIEFCNFNRCDYAFKNSSNDYVYVSITNNCIYVYVTNSFGKEEVIYEKTNDGVNVSFNSFRKFLNVGDLQVIRSTEEETNYDKCGKLVSHCCHVIENTYINGEIYADSMYANYDRKINDYLIDDKLVRLESFNYHYHPKLNRNLCYVSDYQHGMFCSGDASKIIKPRFMPFIGDFSEYKTKIEKNNSKTLKI